MSSAEEIELFGGPFSYEDEFDDDFEDNESDE